MLLTCCFSDCVGVDVLDSSSLESSTRSALLNAVAMLKVVIYVFDLVILAVVAKNMLRY